MYAAVVWMDTPAVSASVEQDSSTVLDRDDIRLSLAGTTTPLRASSVGTNL
jgi:hypothetical protein